MSQPISCGDQYHVLCHVSPSSGTQTTSQLPQVEEGHDCISTGSSTHHRLNDHCGAAAGSGWSGSCNCDLPVLLGMGIKQSKFRDRLLDVFQRDGLDENQKKFADNNHHNHGGTATLGKERYNHHGSLMGLGSPGCDLALISPNTLKITKFKVVIDKRLTTIDERSPGVLKYKTPHFRSYATVDVPAIPEGTNIQVGWIQTCAHMEFVNTYSDLGVTSWEFPEILHGNFSMVSDADGKQYPWYGARQEVATLQGPTPRQQVTVEMNDNFYPQVTWCIPVKGYDHKPRLTQIFRSQKFYTFLALRNIDTQEVHILRAVTWTMDLTIAVDPNKPLGQRGRLVGPHKQSQPCVIEYNMSIPQYALQPPSANQSQTLIWRPRTGEPKLVIPPLESTVDIDSYIVATRNMGQKLASLIPES